MRTFCSFIQIFFGISSIILLINACASKPHPPIPTDLMNVKPMLDCTDCSFPLGWKISGKLSEIDRTTYLVLYIDVGFEPEKAPYVTLETSNRLAEYLGCENSVYYYRLGKVPKSKTIGEVFFASRSHNGNPKQIGRFLLQRKQESDCVIIECIKGKMPDRKIAFIERKKK